MSWTFILSTTEKLKLDVICGQNYAEKNLCSVEHREVFSLFETNKTESIFGTSKVYYYEFMIGFSHNFPMKELINEIMYNDGTKDITYLENFISFRNMLYNFINILKEQNTRIFLGMLNHGQIKWRQLDGKPWDYPKYEHPGEREHITYYEFPNISNNLTKISLKSVLDNDFIIKDDIVYEVIY